ncbi:MAG: D-tyrosyl-tRNA(Tyr) deacylase [Chlamydiae bacterium]|nr:D-tyrosyl-tRNA(Tyr) deacylase [Chlamydiota bacterium]
MRLVVQRVLAASVTVDGNVVGSIQKGLLILLGVHKNDTKEQASWLASKVATLRVFSDKDQKMNLSLKDTEGSVLVVSQFTLYGNCMSGRRPDFLEAAKGSQAEALYLDFVKDLQDLGLNVQTGVFGADMKVSLVNDGPVTFVIESPVI